MEKFMSDGEAYRVKKSDMREVQVGGQSILIARVDDRNLFGYSSVCEALSINKSWMRNKISDQDTYYVKEISEDGSSAKGRAKRFVTKGQLKDMITRGGNMTPIKEELLSLVDELDQPFKVIKKFGSTTTYQVLDKEIRVKEYNGCFLIALDDLANVCGYRNLNSSPLSPYIRNSVKTFFLEDNGNSVQLRTISADQLYKACIEIEFNGSDTILEWLQSSLGCEIQLKEDLEVPQSAADLETIREKEINPNVTFVPKKNANPVTEKLKQFKKNWSEKIKWTVPIGRFNELETKGDQYKVFSPWLEKSWKCGSWKDAQLISENFSDIDFNIKPSDSGTWVECPASPLVTQLDWKEKHLKRFIEAFEHIPSVEELNEFIEGYYEERDKAEPGPEDECHNGTVRHNVSAALLKGMIRKEALTPEESMAFCELVSKEEVILDYVKYAIQDFKKQGFKECLIEHHLPLPFLNKDAQGRSDLIFVRDDKIKVIDFKSGNEKVDVRTNNQLKVYAFGVLANMGYSPKLKEIELQIVQPSINNYEKITMTPQEVLDWGRNVLIPAARKALHPTVEDIHYGVWCKKCGAHNCKCRKMVQNVMQSLG